MAAPRPEDRQWLERLWANTDLTIRERNMLTMLGWGSGAQLPPTSVGVDEEFQALWDAELGKIKTRFGL